MDQSVESGRPEPREDRLRFAFRGFRAVCRLRLGLVASGGSGIGSCSCFATILTVGWTNSLRNEVASFVGNLLLDNSGNHSANRVFLDTRDSPTDSGADFKWFLANFAVGNLSDNRLADGAARSYWNLAYTLLSFNATGADRDLSFNYLIDPTTSSIRDLFDDFPLNNSHCADGYLADFFIRDDSANLHRAHFAFNNRLPGGLRDFSLNNVGAVDRLECNYG